jgi:hypothetical protein
MDICHGHADSPGGFKYSLLIVDYKTSQKYIYGLKGITDADIHNALLAFFVEAGGIPGTIQCDFDTKFIAGSARPLLLERGIRLQSAPGGRQSQNGLAESHWKRIVRMSRAILVNCGMPKRIWFFALRRAVQVRNYLPIMVYGLMTTSFELVHRFQPNYQAILYPIFSHGYFRGVRDGSRDRLQL